MSALGMAVAVLAVGAVAYEAGKRAERDRHLAGRCRHFGDGQQYGYVDGWTAGRVAMVGEERAKAFHPTSSPYGVAVRSAEQVVDLEARRIEREGQ